MRTSRSRSSWYHFTNSGSDVGMGSIPWGTSFSRTSGLFIAACSSALMRAMTASEWQIFRMLRVPNALPFLMAGLELAMIFALIGAIVGEFVGAEKGLEHPTPMALDLAQHLVRLACPPGGLVLDPFAGACTTAVAARALGRHSVCIEVDPAHCAEGARRMGQQALLLA